MPLTQLDTVTALLLIDLQNGMRTLPTMHPMDAVISNARRLARGFRAKNLPVVIVTVAGSAPGRTETPRVAATRPVDWAEPVSELEQATSDLRITKNRWGAFTETGLAEWLWQRGVTQVVIAGVATSVGVESTARHAHELGFHVTLALDAITDLNAAAHEHSIRIFAKLGETGSTEQVLALLDPAPL